MLILKPGSPHGLQRLNVETSPGHDVSDCPNLPRRLGI